MNDQDKFAKLLTGYLDAGAADLKAGTAYSLQQARARALASLAAPSAVAQPRFAPAFAGAGRGGASGTGGLWKSTRLWLGIVAIVVASFGYQQWQVYQQTREIAELDTQLLSSDLPIDAYLDRGFQTWLARPEP